MLIGAWNIEHGALIYSSLNQRRTESPLSFVLCPLSLILCPFKLRSSKSEEVVLFTNQTIIYANIVYLRKNEKL